MGRLIPVSGVVIVLLFQSSCQFPQSNSSPVPPVQFLPVAAEDESTVAEVQRGAPRLSVEEYLARMLTGQPGMITQAIKDGNMERLATRDAFELALRRHYFVGKDFSAARANWEKYPNATFSVLEGGSAVMVFFDDNNLTVDSWPTATDY